MGAVGKKYHISLEAQRPNEDKTDIIEFKAVINANQPASISIDDPYITRTNTGPVTDKSLGKEIVQSQVSFIKGESQMLLNPDDVESQQMFWRSDRIDTSGNQLSLCLANKPKKITNSSNVPLSDMVSLAGYDNFLMAPAENGLIVAWPANKAGAGIRKYAARWQGENWLYDILESLTTSCTNVATRLNVASTANMFAGSLRKLEDEIVTVTSIYSGTQFDCTRGAGATSHAVGTPLYHGPSQFRPITTPLAFDPKDYELLGMEIAGNRRFYSFVYGDMGIILYWDNSNYNVWCVNREDNHALTFGQIAIMCKDKDGAYIHGFENSFNTALDKWHWANFKIPTTGTAPVYATLYNLANPWIDGKVVAACSQNNNLFALVYRPGINRTHIYKYAEVASAMAWVLWKDLPEGFEGQSMTGDGSLIYIGGRQKCSAGNYRGVLYYLTGASPEEILGQLANIGERDGIHNYNIKKLYAHGHNVEFPWSYTMGLGHYDTIEGGISKSLRPAWLGDSGNDSDLVDDTQVNNICSFGGDLYFSLQAIPGADVALVLMVDGAITIPATYAHYVSGINDTQDYQISNCGWPQSTGSVLFRYRVSGDTSPLPATLIKLIDDSANHAISSYRTLTCDGAWHELDLDPVSDFTITGSPAKISTIELHTSCGSDFVGNIEYGLKLLQAASPVTCGEIYRSDYQDYHQHGTMDFSLYDMGIQSIVKKFTSVVIETMPAISGVNAIDVYLTIDGINYKLMDTIDQNSIYSIDSIPPYAAKYFVSILQSLENLYGAMPGARAVRCGIRLVPRGNRLDTPRIIRVALVAKPMLRSPNSDLGKRSISLVIPMPSKQSTLDGLPDKSNLPAKVRTLRQWGREGRTIAVTFIQDYMAKPEDRLEEVMYCDLGPITELSNVFDNKYEPSIQIVLTEI